MEYHFNWNYGKTPLFYEHGAFIVVRHILNVVVGH